MVSANLPDEKPGVTKELERQHASTRNLQFASDDTYAMQAAFDAKFSSGGLITFDCGNSPATITLTTLSASGSWFGVQATFGGLLGGRETAPAPL